MVAGAQRLRGGLVPAAEMRGGAVGAGGAAAPTPSSQAAQAAEQREARAAAALDPHRQVAQGSCDPGVDEAAADWRIFEHRDRATELAEEAVRRLEEESDSSDGMAVSG